MNIYKPVEVTALDAAKVQLDTAIGLFLLNVHPAPIHTLVGAAQELLKGLSISYARARGSPAPFTHLDEKEMALRMMRTSKMNDIRNFLKHKVAEAQSTVSLNIDINSNWILDCIDSLAAMNEPPSAMIQLQIDWVLDVHFKQVTFPPGTAFETIVERVVSERGHPFGTAETTISWLKDKLSGPTPLAVPDWFRASVFGSAPLADQPQA